MMNAPSAASSDVPAAFAPPQTSSSTSGSSASDLGAQAFAGPAPSSSSSSLASTVPHEAAHVSQQAAGAPFAGMY